MQIKVVVVVVVVVVTNRPDRHTVCKIGAEIACGWRYRPCGVCFVTIDGCARSVFF